MAKAHEIRPYTVEIEEPEVSIEELAKTKSPTSSPTTTNSKSKAKQINDKASSLGSYGTSNVKTSSHVLLVTSFLLVLLFL